MIASTESWTIMRTIILLKRMFYFKRNFAAGQNFEWKNNLQKKHLKYVLHLLQDKHLQQEQFYNQSGNQALQCVHFLLLSQSPIGKSRFPWKTVIGGKGHFYGCLSFLKALFQGKYREKWLFAKGMYGMGNVGQLWRTAQKSLRFPKQI